MKDFAPATPPWRIVAGAVLVAAAALSGHLGASGLLLAIGVAIQVVPPVSRTAAGLNRQGHEGGSQEATAAPRVGSAPPEQPVWRRAGWGALPALLSATLVALGLGLIGAVGGEWRYGAPAAGQGLNNTSLALLLAGALLAAGAADLPLAGRVAPGVGEQRRPGADRPEAALATVGALYGLLRLFSLGPWNLGWLFAALLAGGAVALWAAWLAAAAAPEAVALWSGLWLAGTALAGVGLASGAGVTLAGYAMLLGPVLRLGLTAPRPSRAHWMLSAAVPLSGPMILAWLAVAAALAGGVTVLAAVLWAAALLAALPAARLGLAGDGPASRAALVAAGLSAVLGLGAPFVVGGLLQPVAAQLRGGLTPFGEIELWPWAGLIAFDAARQPVATLPSLALGALMVILSALCWVVLRLVRRP